MNKNINEMEILKFENFLGEIEKKIQWKYDDGIDFGVYVGTAMASAMFRREERKGSIIDLIFFDEKMNPLIESLCKKSYNDRIPEECNYKYELKELNEKSRYNIISKYIEEYNSKINKPKKVTLRYLFYGILGTLLVEEPKKYIELISDLAVCLNVENEEISDIVNVVKYVTDGDSFEFKSDTCEKVFGEIVNK